MIYKFARFLLMATSALTMIYGVGITFNPDLITDHLDVFYNMRQSEFTTSNMGVRHYFSKLIQLFGGFHFLIGGIGLIAVLKSFTLSSKSLLAIIFLACILGHAGPIFFAFKTGFFGWVGTIEIFSFVLALVAFGGLLVENNEKRY